MTDRPNVLLYVSDSLRADHVSCLGYERETTPHLDALAADGYRFENAFAQAIMTMPSSVSLLTGLYPETHGAMVGTDAIPDGVPRIAERFRRAGYRTAAVSSIVHVSERRNFGPGFDRFDEVFDGLDVGADDPARLCADRAIEWLDSGTDPFFALVWSIGPHQPYRPLAGEFAADGSPDAAGVSPDAADVSPDADHAGHPIDGSGASLKRASFADRERVRDLYDDAIRHEDEQFGRLVRYLKDTGRYDDTLVVHTADHGELLSEHARIEHAHPVVRSLATRLCPGACDRYALFERSGQVGHLFVLPYDELLHVPAVLKPPDRPDAGPLADVGCDGVAVPGLVESVDLVPTVADLAGIEFGAQGRSLAGTMAGDDPGKEYVFSDSVMSPGIGRSRSVRSLSHKLVVNELPLGSLTDSRRRGLSSKLASVVRHLLQPGELLLDVAAGERTDRKRDRPETARRLREALAARSTANRDAAEGYRSRTAAVGADVADQLEALGYA